MNPGRVCWAVGLALILSAVGWARSGTAANPVEYQFQILHTFGAAGDGVAPGGTLVMDSKGDLYGTTQSGGAYGGGTVYELSTEGDGQWTETILHSFQADDPSDGYDPSGVAIDGAGNLYGTTLFGGDSVNNRCDGCGTVFELSPGVNGVWKEIIVYNFCSLPDCADGVSPGFAPTLGPEGSLYGIAAYAAYQLTPGSGGWTFDLLYTFCDIGHDCTTGASPSSGLTLDLQDNLYGETAVGGQCSSNPLGCGVAYALHQQTNGQWEEFVLYEFQKDSIEDGGNPQGGLTFQNGGLYGVAQAGGDRCIQTGGCGTVFELTHGSGKTINEKTVWNFGGQGGAQGVSPIEGVVFDQRGDLFGVTGEGGSPSCECGVVYGMKSQAKGQWAYQVLHTFNGPDGVEPDGALTLDTKGSLFGTTGGGGPMGGGVLYELSPVKQAN